nr:uncharacterized protein LOC113693292 [Coffea arabica]
MVQMCFRHPSVHVHIPQFSHGLSQHRSTPIQSLCFLHLSVSASPCTSPFQSPTETHEIVNRIALLFLAALSKLLYTLSQTLCQFILALSYEGCLKVAKIFFFFLIPVSLILPSVVLFSSIVAWLELLRWGTSYIHDLQHNSLLANCGQSCYYHQSMQFIISFKSLPTVITNFCRQKNASSKDFIHFSRLSPATNRLVAYLKVSARNQKAPSVQVFE